MEQFAAIVIGAGQAGVPLAQAFAKAGKKTALIERAEVGGTCVNYGCTPTKTLVGIAKVAQTVRRAAEFGVHTSRPEVDMRKARELKRAMVNDFREGLESSLAKTENLELIRGHALFTGPKRVELNLTDGNTCALEGSQIFLNVGTRPLIPDLEGLDTVPYLDNQSIMELDEVPESLLILGGGYIGLEFGQMFARFGTKVTILDHGKRFLPREDDDVAEAILKILKEDGIDVRSGIDAKQVAKTANGIQLKTDNDTFEATHLLVATGRRPNTDDLGLDKAGIDTDEHGFIKVDEHLKATADGVYGLGDAKGGPAFTHISYDDYRILKTNLLEHGNRTTEGRLIPNTVFIDPQLGRVGLNELEAKQSGTPYRVAKLEMGHVARAVETYETRGFIKALVDPKTDKILGVSVLGTEGGEIMAMLQLAMQGGLTGKDLANSIFAHPTLAEALNNLFA